MLRRDERGRSAAFWPDDGDSMQQTIKQEARVANDSGREIIQIEEKVPLVKAIPLSLRHLFAMFGASVLVPILFNGCAKQQVIDPSLVLIMNGIGTLASLFVCRGKAPAFLGSSLVRTEVGGSEVVCGRLPRRLTGLS